MSKLAILGGKPVRIKPFPAYVTIGEEEKAAVARVLDSGILSQYLGAWHSNFLGGKEVRALEEEWADYFGVKYAVAVNSATSGLYCAVGATGVGPGDSIIVSPYTMSASAVAPLVYGAIPKFADIEKEFYCLDVDSIKKNINGSSKAIIAVDIFGLPYDATKINEIAKKNSMVVIEDCAQAPGAKLNGKFAGTLGDIGIFSLNYHKHIHCGEGGIVVTDNQDFCERIRLIRNHAEAVVDKKGEKNLVNMIGFNYRMTEIEAAIAREQLKKLNNLLSARVDRVEYLESQLKKIPFLKMPQKRMGATHAYYLHTIQYMPELAGGVPRQLFVEALKAELAPITLREAEGVKIGEGYCRPLYRQGIYQNKIAFGSGGYPWVASEEGKRIKYQEGDCPNAEFAFEHQVITHEYIQPSLQRSDLDDVILAFNKVAENIDHLKKYTPSN